MATKERLSPEEQMKKDYEEAKRRTAGGGGALFINALEGDNIFRLMPPWKDGENWYRKVPLHYGIFPKNEKMAFTCPKVLAEIMMEEATDCPVCDIAQKLFDKGGKDDIKKAKRFMAKTNYYANVLVVSTPDGDKEGDVRVYRFGPQIYTQIVDLMMAKWGDLSDPVKGRPIMVKRTGSGQMDTEYNVFPEPDAMPLKKDVIAKIHNLDDGEGVVEIWSAAQLEAIMEGEELDDIRVMDEEGGGKKDAKKADKKDDKKDEKKVEEKGDKKDDKKKEAPEPATSGWVTPNKKQMLQLIEVATENDVELPDDTGDADVIFAAFRKETDGLRAKNFSDALDLLKELGATVDGKNIEWPDPKPEASGDDGDGEDYIKKQMEEMRRRKAEKKK